ncbi:MAG: histone [Promethearchaeota archaeon]
MGKKSKPAKNKDKAQAAEPAPDKAPAPKPKEAIAKPDFIAKAPIRRLMKSYGANLVAEDALLALIGFLETFGMDVTKKAIEIATKEKRKRVTADDIMVAAKSM